MSNSQDKTPRIRTRFAKREIPSALVYEVWDGKSLYYKDFKDVLNGLKSFEEIMGQSDTQSIIIGVILKHLFNVLPDEYFITSNEVGLHLDKKNNTSSDIVIYDNNQIKQYQSKDKYFAIPPLALIEVDIKADIADFGISQMDYYSMKTKKMLDFGVREVLWVFSSTKKIMTAKPHQDWIISDWDKEIKFLEHYTISLGNLLEKVSLKI